MRVITTDQQYAPLFLQWLNERCHGNAKLNVETTRTIAHLEVNEGQPPEILVVTALANWSPFTCEATLATDGSKRPKASREYIFTIFDYVFRHAKKERLYTYVGVENEKSIAVQELLGLKREAILRDHFGPDKDAILFGITKRDWQSGPWASPETSVPINTSELSGNANAIRIDTANNR